MSAIVVLGIALCEMTTVRAAQIRLRCAVALHPAIDVLVPEFEKTSGNKVTAAYGNAGAIAARAASAISDERATGRGLYDERTVHVE